MKARGRRLLLFVECLETPVKHEARVFEMASQSAPNCKQKKTKKHTCLCDFCFLLFNQRTVCDDNVVRVFHN